MKITFYGHASLGIEVNGVKIIVDPFITGNPKASHIDVNSLEADYILLTHAHQDHILDVETIAQNNDVVIVSNFEIVSHYEKKGFEGHPMNHGGSWDFEFGTVMYVNAIHTSSFPDGSYGGQLGDNFTMDVDGAIIASDFVQCDKVLGYHYDTFGYIEIDHEEAKRKFFDKNKDLMLLNIGDSLEL